MSSVVLVWLILIDGLSYGLAQHQIVENCEISLNRCTTRMVCGLALHDYRISCKQELYGKSNTSCSELCQLAIISLAMTTEGYDYLNCDCADNKYCHILRERTKPCYPEGDASTKLCRVSELYCRADSTCSEAWNYYRYLCEETFNGKGCTKRCNNSVSILNRRKVGVNIKECICDGDNNYYKKCSDEKRNIFRLCYGIELPNDEDSTRSCGESIFKVYAQNQHNLQSLMNKISYFFVFMPLIILI